MFHRKKGNSLGKSCACDRLLKNIEGNTGDQLQGGRRGKERHRLRRANRGMVVLSEGTSKASHKRFIFYRASKEQCGGRRKSHIPG